ncbi:MAG: hypothetical protein ACLFRU_09025 [Paracoccaceae bacterium]
MTPKGIPLLLVACMLSVAACAPAQAPEDACAAADGPVDFRTLLSNSIHDVYETCLIGVRGEVTSALEQ